MFNVGLAGSFTEYHTMLVSALLCAGGRLLCIIDADDRHESCCGWLPV